VKKALIAIGVLVVIAIMIIVNLRKEGSKTEVQVTEVKRRDITKVVTASGTIQPKRSVDVSASAIGKITKLAVKEGDIVKKGDFLLQIDPTTYQSIVDQLEAAIRSADATLEMEKANLRKAEYDLERVKTLYDEELVSEEELRNAAVGVDIYRARVKTARENLLQQEANLKKASHELREVRITAEMSGIITALNVEEGENAIMGTLNNPGTVLLTVADLSEIEAEVQVDETEVVDVRVGQEATVELDAYPDTSFAGVVTEVGNSALRSQLVLGQESVDFKVVIAIQESVPGVRPGLSASADIEVGAVRDGMAVPIQCLTVRRPEELEGDAGSAGSSGEKGDIDEEDEEDADTDEGDGGDELEGVFIVESGRARFRQIDVGIAGERYFHVRSGLQEGDKVVSGPFKAINELKDGDPVKLEKKKSTNK
jgi:HlyD family secretion protein